MGEPNNETKLTGKQETFCQLYIETGNASEAYRQAYNTDKMKAETVHRKATELMNNGKITARIGALQITHQQRHNITVDSLLDELEKARQMASNTGNPSAMISATMGKAKLLGYDKQAINLTSDDGTLAMPTIIKLVGYEKE